jgi:hypothetical protein
MRRKLVLGVGLAALVGSSAAGQFAADRVPPAGTPMGAPKAAPAPLPGGLQPAGPTTPAPVLGGFEPLTPPTVPVSPAAPSAPLYTPMYSSPPAASGYVPPVDGLRPAPSALPANGAPPSLSALPANIEIPTVLGKDHPWLLKPEHGPYFIMVKSYVRPAAGSRAATVDRGLTARELAEGLAREIRDTYRVQAFLYEYISEERKAEMRANIAARQKAETEYVAQVKALEQKAVLQGMEFMEPENKYRVWKHEQRDQIGVLVGGFQTEADAAKALAVMKGEWRLPKNTALLDKALILNAPDKGQATSEGACINPYASAFVVPNPAIAKASQPAAQRQGLEPFVVKLNDGNPYSLLKANKKWTLAVKSFTAPVEVVSRNSDTSAVRKMGHSNGADALNAGAVQAESLAKALRGMKGKGGESLNLEAFVLHTRYASLVTVGQFDGPDDPALLATKRMLAGITMKVSEDQTGFRPVTNTPSLFDTMLPMPIPKP